MTEAPPSLFEFSKVPQGDPLLNEIFKLRYKVYVEECGFEKREDHPGGIERDEFDEHSVHFVVRRMGEEQIIGTIRMINNSDKGFLITKHCKMDMDFSLFDKNRFGELSRLAVSKQYRRRTTDTVLEGGIVEDYAIDNMFGGKRRMECDIVLGLYKCIYLECKERGHEYVMALMAKGLYLLLKRVGLAFEPIGPEQNYHGLRTPYLGKIDKVMQELEKKNPALYRQFMR